MFSDITPHLRMVALSIIYFYTSLCKQTNIAQCSKDGCQLPIPRKPKASLCHASKPFKPHVGQIEPASALLDARTNRAGHLSRLLQPHVGQMEPACPCQVS